MPRNCRVFFLRLLKPGLECGRSETQSSSPVVFMARLRQLTIFKSAYLRLVHCVSYSDHSTSYILHFYIHFVQ